MGQIQTRQKHGGSNWKKSGDRKKIRVHPCPSGGKLFPQWNTKPSSDWKPTSSSKQNPRCGVATPNKNAKKRTKTSVLFASECPACCPCRTTRHCGSRC